MDIQTPHGIRREQHGRRACDLAADKHLLHVAAGKTADRGTADIRGNDLKIVHNDPEGAYYVMLDISEFGYESDLQFCEDLASKVGVGAVPGSSFFHEPVNHLIRLHFAKKDETLTDALNRLESLREKIPAKG